MLYRKLDLEKRVFIMNDYLSKIKKPKEFIDYSNKLTKLLNENIIFRTVLIFVNILICTIFITLKNNFYFITPNLYMTIVTIITAIFFSYNIIMMIGNIIAIGDLKKIDLNILKESDNYTKDIELELVFSKGFVENTKPIMFNEVIFKNLDLPYEALGYKKYKIN